MKHIRLKYSNELIPVGKIVCIGRNYIEHAAEMKSEIPESPIIFLKPSTALIYDGDSIVIPNISKNMQHEVELVVAISQKAKNINIESAYNYVLGYGVGLDMTLRDVQSEAKKKGLPWSIAKGFDTSAPISDIIPVEKINEPHKLELICRVNGEIRQHDSTEKMIFKVDKLIQYISNIFTLERGDLIFTGTPEGVSQVFPGDVIEAEIPEIVKIKNTVIAAT